MNAKAAKTAAKQTEGNEMTLEQAKQKIRDAGHRVSEGACWEDDYMVYASSVASYGRGTYGHPQYEVQFSKATGWITATGENNREQRHDRIAYKVAV